MRCRRRSSQPFHVTSNAQKGGAAQHTRPRLPFAFSLRESAAGECVVEILDRLRHVAQRGGHISHTFTSLLHTISQLLVALLELTRSLLRLEAILDKVIDVTLQLVKKLINRDLAIVQL